MIITKTKDIFLKRLKRQNKMLTQEGSSDQSKSNELSRSIQLHTNTFLHSVDSSQLSKKTAQLKDQLFLKISQNDRNQESFDSEVHDIHNPQIEFNQQTIQRQKQQSFANKLLRLTKNISLNQMIDSEAVQISLAPIESEVSHLLWDFDELDKEQTLKNYEKLKKKEKQNIKQPEYTAGTGVDKKSAFDKRKKISDILITPINQKEHISFEYQTSNNLKSNRPSYKPFSRQMKYSSILSPKEQAYIKRSNIYDSINIQDPKMSAIYEKKRSNIFNSPQEGKYINFSSKFVQNSPRNQYNYTNNQKTRVEKQRNLQKEFLDHLYSGQQTRPKIMSKKQGKQQTLQRHKSNNMLNIQKSPPHLNRQEVNMQRSSFYTQSDPYRRPFQHPQYLNINLQSQRNDFPHSTYNKNAYQNSRNVTEFNTIQQSRKSREYQSPRFKDLKQQQIYEQQAHNIHPMQLRMKQKHYNFQKTGEKVTTNNLHTKFGSPYNQAEYDEKQQKKKKIREKAAQLLNRVKSQQYLIGRVQTQYMQHGTRRY